MPKLVKRQERARIIEGDCLAVMRKMASNSVDSVVTDPPYGLNFMGKDWDSGDIVRNVDMWRELWRVLKPGGHLLSFGGTRTAHRIVCAIEDAGFEIRDSIMWVYGSGFPKSGNVSKAIDKKAGAKREVVGPSPYGPRGKAGQSYSETRKVSWDCQPQPVTAPATDAAKQWDGWGTALKPAWEPICLARKPLAGTVAENVQRYGTGALNIEGCRVENVTVAGGNLAQNTHLRKTVKGREDAWFSSGDGERLSVPNVAGRWPANVIHDGSEEVLDAFARFSERKQGAGSFGKIGGDIIAHDYGGDTGSAARFFYCAKASKADRDEGLAAFAEKQHVQFQTANGTSGKPSSISEGRDTRYRNTHPTVKPTALMRYLCRLVTQPGGLILDPFAGSGSTGKAAIAEGFRFVGIELEPAYAEIARARIVCATKHAGKDFFLR